MDSPSSPLRQAATGIGPLGHGASGGPDEMTTARPSPAGLITLSSRPLTLEAWTGLRR
jgi:hypothetical protein